jgi:hypothetical protein
MTCKPRPGLDAEGSVMRLGFVPEIEHVTMAETDERE